MPSGGCWSHCCHLHAADIQDRDGAPLVLAEIVRRFPCFRHVFADGGYAGDKLRDALRRIVSVAATPPMPGMRKSIRTISGTMSAQGGQCPLAAICFAYDLYIGYIRSITAMLLAARHQQSSFPYSLANLTFAGSAPGLEAEARPPGEQRLCVVGEVGALACYRHHGIW